MDYWIINAPWFYSLLLFNFYFYLEMIQCFKVILFLFFLKDKIFLFQDCGILLNL